MLAHVVLVIPAYRPSTVLTDLVGSITAQEADRRIRAVVIVDDGSGPEYRHVFDAFKSWSGVTVLRHAVNLGKGAALKTGFNHALLAYPDAVGVVTADADGQHTPADIFRVAALLSEGPEQIVLGVREFAARVPFRSRLGNIVTRSVFKIFTGVSLCDTQTGLRGWPRKYCLESLTVAINGYDFELECLLKAHNGASHSAIPIRQVPIQTIYVDGNRGSHFNPLRDSMRIYFVFIRYCGASIMAAVIDSLTFSLVYKATDNLLASQVAGRALAVAIAFVIARNVVFRSDLSVVRSLTRYLAFAAIVGAVSFGMINYLREIVGVPVLLAKLLAEGLLFVGNFSIQRQIVFARSRADKQVV